MSTKHWLIIGCALAVLVGLLISKSAPSSLADVSVSEHYRLVAAEVGNAPAAMQSESYVMNEDVVLQAQVAPPMESENYKSGGEVPHKVYLPLVLRSWE
jgi:hypothetical protein